MQHLSCISDRIGQCLLPQTSSLATFDSTLGGLPNGLGTLRSGPACANIFLLTRVHRKSLCDTRLVTTGCLAVRLRLWQPWHTFRTSLNWNDIALKWNDVTWYSHFVTIGVKNQFRYFSGLQQPWLLAWSTHCATTHTDCQMVTGKKNKLSMQHWI